MTGPIATAITIAVAMEGDRVPRTKIGSAIKRRRGHLELSQSRLSELSGIAQGHISQIERGERRPSLQTLLKLRDALALPPDEFSAWLEDAA